MNKYYEEPLITVLTFGEEIVRTSMVEDTFDDGYKDPNITG